MSEETAAKDTPPDPGAQRTDSSGRLGKIAFLMTLLPVVAWGACATKVLGEDAGFLVWGLACALAVAGAIMGLVFRQSGWGWGALFTGIASPVVTAYLGFAVAPGFHMQRGRSLRRRGQPRFPATTPSDAWLAEVGAIADAPQEVADGWRANAATETASVASFAHLATELLAVGAPAELVERAHQDAVDEVRHARLCYALATAVDGARLGPAPFPSAAWPRDSSPTLRTLAEDSAVESCLFESASAAVARRLAARDDVPEAIRAVLETIAVDEARHAAHGLEIVEWCAAQGGAAIVAHMRAAVAKAAEAPIRAAVTHDALERFGLAGPALWRRCIEESRRELESRLPFEGAGGLLAA